MSIVLYNKPKQNDSYWFDSHTVKNIQCIFVNLFFEKVNPLLFIANLPLRVYSCINAYQEKSYWKIALDIASLACLILLGIPFCIVLDLVSLGVNLYLKRDRSEKDEFDCTKRENALRVLGLSEQEAQDKATLDNRYRDQSSALNMRIVQAQQSKPLVASFKKLLNRVEISYQTLSRTL